LAFKKLTREHRLVALLVVVGEHDLGVGGGVAVVVPVSLRRDNV
jgi:hypothetical protein